MPYDNVNFKMFCFKTLISQKHLNSIEKKINKVQKKKNK